MTSTHENTNTGFDLPPSVVSRVDVARMLQDAERVDNLLTTAAVRKKVGSEDSVEITLSESFEAFLQINKLEFSTGQQRRSIIQQLKFLKDNVPIIHMTFAVEADRESLGVLVSWLREHVHRQAVVATGLQPALVAGVYMRTNNHVHDMSLRAKLESSRDVLIRELEAARG